MLERSRFWKTAVLSVVLATLPAWAQQAPPDEAPALRDYVKVDVTALPSSNTIGTKQPVTVLDAPAHVGTVTAPLMREQRAMVLGDALENVSGVNVVSGVGVFDFFTVRGYDSLSSSLVMTDGVVEPEVTFYPTYNIEGVEVLKGPAGFLYGMNPLAAAVNMVRKQPLPANFGTFAASVGSFGTAEGSLDWNLGAKERGPDFRLNGMWRQADGWRDDKESRHLGLNPSMTFRAGAHGIMNLNLEHVDAEFTPDSGLPLVDGSLPAVPRRRSYQLPFDSSEQSIDRLQLDYETPLTDHLRLRNKTYHRNLDWQTDGTLFNGVFPTGSGGALEVSRTLTLLDDEQRFSGNQLEALLDFATGRITHQLLGGLELARQTDDFATSIGFPPNLDLLDPVETATDVVSFPFLVGDQRSTIIAPYVLDRLQLSPRVELSLGARFDMLETDVRYAVNGQEPGIDSYERSDDKLSPLAGLVIKPGPDWTLFASAGSSFAPIGARVRGAATLGVEESNQLELGAKKQLAEERLFGSIVLYQTERENIGIPDDNGLTQQAGDQRSRGIELELAAQLRPRLRTFLSYAYNDAELTRFAELVRTPGSADFVVVDRSGNDPAFAPEHLARLWLAYSFANGVGLAGGLRHFSDQFIAEDNQVRIDGALLADAALFYDWGQCRVQLNVRNLTDADYETRGFGTTSVTPGQPFAAHLGFDWRF